MSARKGPFPPNVIPFAAAAELTLASFAVAALGVAAADMIDRWVGDKRAARASRMIRNTKSAHTEKSAKRQKTGFDC